MRLIQLTQNKYAKVDDQDFDFLSQWKWQYNGGYAIHSSRTNRLSMHLLLLQAPEGKEIDHINRDKLDNRRSNLRIVTRNENQWNRGLSRNNRSGIKGVSFIQKCKKWYASIWYESKCYNLGLYENLEDAVIARKEAEGRMHQFA